MIEIYKKLPATNCGKCGMPSCMAFALKVKKSQAGLSDCPFMGKEMPKEGESAPGAASSSSYEQVSLELEKETVGMDFRKAAAAIGGTYKSDDGKEAVGLKMMHKEYELRKNGLFENNVYCLDPWTKIIIYDYVRRQGDRPLTGEWIALGHFPHTASLVKAFQSSAEKKISESFKNDLDGLKRRCAGLGGGETEGKVKADYICRLDLLPHVPIYLHFWAADEEFDADCKLLFDGNAENHIDIEYLAHLVESFIAELVGQ